MNFRRFAYLLSTSLLALTFAACGGGGDTVADKLSDIESEAAVQGDILCDCYASFPVPYDNKEACVAESGEVDPAYRQCAIDAFELDEAASITGLECQLAAMEVGTGCLNQNLDCNNLMNSFLACVGEQATALEACAPLPANVQTALDACTSADPLLGVLSAAARW